jgi:hypothetical protein
METMGNKMNYKKRIVIKSGDLNKSLESNMAEFINSYLKLNKKEQGEVIKLLKSIKNYEFSARDNRHTVMPLVRTWSNYLKELLHNEQ